MSPSTTKRKAPTKDHDLLIKIESHLESQSKTLDQILEEARKTNGRVRVLENIRTEERLKNIEPRLLDLDKFAAGLKGSWRATVALSAVISAVLTFILTIIL